MGNVRSFSVRGWCTPTINIKQTLASFLAAGKECWIRNVNSTRHHRIEFGHMAHNEERRQASISHHHLLPSQYNAFAYEQYCARFSQRQRGARCAWCVRSRFSLAYMHEHNIQCLYTIYRLLAGIFIRILPSRRCCCRTLLCNSHPIICASSWQTFGAIATYNSKPSGTSGFFFCIFPGASGDG